MIIGFGPIKYIDTEEQKSDQNKDFNLHEFRIQK